MSGSLAHLGGDRWKVRIYAGLDARGRQRTRARTFHANGRRAAERASSGHIAAMRAEIDAGRADRGTVREAVREWVKSKAATGSSATRYRNRSIVNAIDDGLGHHRLDELTARHIDAWYAQLRADNIGTDTRPRHRTESTIHHYHRVLAAILRQAEKWEMVDRVATRNATPPKRRAVELRVPTSRVLLDVIGDATPDLRFAAALAARTGLRRGELVGLRWSDVQGSTIVVSRSIIETPGVGLEVKSTKSERPRRIRVGAETVAALAAHRADLAERAAALGATLVDDGPILADMHADRTGATPRRPGWLSLAWRRLCLAHGVKIRLHDLRHWHATTLIDQGIPLATVADRLGHAQTSTTVNIYAHAVEESDDLAAAAVERVMALNSPAPQVPPE